jgi:nucleotidyltransferase AbiEii toxin of type IV toxin-antitoxin system
LADVGLGPIEVLVVPLERQLAEKLHAYTRQYDGATTRAKDLVDFILVRQHGRVDAERLKDAIQRTFARRGTHPVPQYLSAPLPDLAVAYRREVEVVRVVTSLGEAHKLAVQWLNPVLACTARGSWDPSISRWVE